MDLDDLTKSEQTARYLKQYGAVLITNLREFRLLVRHPDGTDGMPHTLERYVLAVTDDELWYGKVDAKHNALLPEFLGRTMLRTVPLTEPKAGGAAAGVVCAGGAGAGAGAGGGA